MTINPHDDDRLQHRLRTLATDREPPTDLWPAIADSLAPRVTAAPPSPPSRPIVRARRWRWLGPSIAAALVLASLQAWFGRSELTPMGDQPGQATAPATAAATEPDSTRVLIDAYAGVLELARGSDMGIWLAAQPGGPERMAAARELDASMAGLAAALRYEPDSQLIRRLMHQTLQQRIALMRRLDA
jgi:hypothetical protein